MLTHQFDYDGGIDPNFNEVLAYMFKKERRHFDSTKCDKSGKVVDASTNYLAKFGRQSPQFGRRRFLVDWVCTLGEKLKLYRSSVHLAIQVSTLSCSLQIKNNFQNR